MNDEKKSNEKPSTLIHSQTCPVTSRLRDLAEGLRRPASEASLTPTWMNQFAEALDEMGEEIHHATSPRQVAVGLLRGLVKIGPTYQANVPFGQVNNKSIGNLIDAINDLAPEPAWLRQAPASPESFAKFGHLARDMSPGARIAMRQALDKIDGKVAEVTKAYGGKVLAHDGVVTDDAWRHKEAAWLRSVASGAEKQASGLVDPLMSAMLGGQPSAAERDNVRNKARMVRDLANLLFPETSRQVVNSGGVLAWARDEVKRIRDAVARFESAGGMSRTMLSMIGVDLKELTEDAARIEKIVEVIDGKKAVESAPVAKASSPGLTVVKDWLRTQISEAALAADNPLLDLIDGTLSKLTPGRGPKQLMAERRDMFTAILDVLDNLPATDTKPVDVTIAGGKVTVLSPYDGTSETEAAAWLRATAKAQGAVLVDIRRMLDSSRRIGIADLITKGERAVAEVETTISKLNNIAALLETINQDETWLDKVQAPEAVAWLIGIAEETANRSDMYRADGNKKRADELMSRSDRLRDLANRLTVSADLLAPDRGIFKTFRLVDVTKGVTRIVFHGGSKDVPVEVGNAIKIGGPTKTFDVKVLNDVAFLNYDGASVTVNANVGAEIAARCPAAT